MVTQTSPMALNDHRNLLRGGTRWIELSVVLALGATALLGWSGSLQQTAFLSLVTAVVGVRHLLRVGGVCAPALFAVVVAGFHFGLSVPILLAQPAREYRLPGVPGDPLLVEGLQISMVGFVSFVAVASATMQGRSRTRTAYVSQPPILTNTGNGLIALGVGLWFFFSITAGGPSILVSSYQTYKAATASAPFDYVFWAVGIGTAIAANSDSQRSLRLTYALLGLWAIPALPLGLRGELLIPAVLLAYVRIKRRGDFPFWPSLLAVVLILSMSAAIKDIRGAGIASVETDEVSLNPIAAIEEFGYSVRPVMEVLRWEDWGEQAEQGATYWAPTDRLLSRLTLSPRLPASQDDRLMNVKIRSRNGPIGFSIVAEAYANFRIAGVVLILGLTGFLVARIDRLSDPYLYVTGLGVLVILLLHVRNAFVPVVPQTIFTGILIAAVRFAQLERGTTTRTD